MGRFGVSVVGAYKIQKNLRLYFRNILRCGGSKEVSGLMNPVVARLRKFLEESTLNVFIREVRGLKLFFFIL